jgi:hypothetical protein
VQRQPRDHYCWHIELRVDGVYYETAQAHSSELRLYQQERHWSESLVASISYLTRFTSYSSTRSSGARGLYSVRLCGLLSFSSSCSLRLRKRRPADLPCVRRASGLPRQGSNSMHVLIT